MKVLVVESVSKSTASFEEKFNVVGDLCEVVHGYKAAAETLSLYEYDCTVVNTEAGFSDLVDFLTLHEQNNNIGGLILVSSSFSVEEKVKLFELGADDIVSAPIHFSELSARITAVVRRKKFQTNKKIYFANLIIEFHQRKVLVWNNAVDLTKKEYEILLYLIGNKDKVVEKIALAEYLWGDETDSMDSFNILAAHIKNIRRKLKNAKAEVEIKNSYGVGYQIIEL